MYTATLRVYFDGSWATKVCHFILQIALLIFRMYIVPSSIVKVCETRLVCKHHAVIVTQLCILVSRYIKNRTRLKNPRLRPIKDQQHRLLKNGQDNMDQPSLEGQSEPKAPTSLGLTLTSKALASLRKKEKTLTML